MSRAGLWSVLAIALGGLGLAGCRSAPAPGPAAAADEAGLAPSAAGLVYVSNQDDATVTVVDAGTLEVLTTVDLEALGYGANAKPHHVVAAGDRWYVSLIGANRVLQLDRGNRVLGEAEFEAPGMLSLDPNSDRLLVGRSMSAVNPPERIGIIDRESMAVEELSVFFPRPHAVASHPTLPVAYSASLAENSLAVIRVQDEHVAVEPIAPSPAGMHGGVHTLVQWAVSPDGQTLVGTGEMSGQLLVYDLSDPLVPKAVTQVNVRARPWHPVFSPDGSEVWFANKGANSVTVVDTDSWAVADVITGEGLAEPHGAALSADGRYVFVSNNNLRGGYPGDMGTLVVIDRAAREIVKVIPLGRNPTGVATSPATNVRR